MLFLKWNQTHKGQRDLENPYTRFLYSELILRDQLAIDRTVLANERTFLAYCRTFLTMILTGMGFIKFFDTPFMKMSGYAFIVIGILIFLLGSWRSSITARNITRAGAGMKRRREHMYGSAPDKTDKDSDNGGRTEDHQEETSSGERLDTH
jgi:putative membrane protein